MTGTQHRAALAWGEARATYLDERDRLLLQLEGEREALRLSESAGIDHRMRSPWSHYLKSAHVDWNMDIVEIAAPH